ncbi:hypothetical protein U1738_10885 [Sphingomonas sp. GB1N7]
MTHKLDSVSLDLDEGETQAQAAARIGLSPLLRHSAIATGAGQQLAKFPGIDVDGSDAYNAMVEQAAKARLGDLGFASDALIAQAHTLDATTTELIRRAFLNMGVDGHHEIFKSYMTLALKAQSNCRATIEALTKLHQPREQTVHHRHYHIGPDGQAVFVENAYGGTGNAGITDQAHATITALPGSDAIGYGVPISGGKGEEPLPNARGCQRKRRSSRKSQRNETRLKVGGD